MESKARGLEIHEKLVSVAFSCLLVFCCFTSPAEAPVSEGVGKALRDIMKAWERESVHAAARMCTAAEETFPESVDIRLASGILLEIAGEAEEAYARYEAIAEEMGVMQATLMPRYRLSVQMGDVRKALELRNNYWSTAGQGIRLFFKEEEAIFLAFQKIEEAALVADGLKDFGRAAAGLKEAEAMLRARYRRADKEALTDERPSLFDMTYRYCVYELGRVAECLTSGERGVCSRLARPSIKSVLWGRETSS